MNQAKQISKHRKYIQNRFFSWIIYIFIGMFLAISLNSCSQIIVNEYDAFAVTTYTWRVEYFISRNEKRPRVEEFASTSLININGEKPENAFSGPDDQGLWWPQIPPKPSLDETEDLEKPGENHSRPELLRTVKYSLKYQHNGNIITMPTNYSVYRQAAKAYVRGESLKLTLGISDQSVQKAERKKD